MENSLSGVTSWLYVLGDVGKEDATKIATSDAGLVVIDATDFSGDNPRSYTSSDLEALRGGQEKLLVSYLSIGEAEDYRSYWKREWSDDPPEFLSTANPEWPDNYTVKYWDQAWQEIVFQAVDDIVAAGFNGLYLDIVDAFEFWEDVAPDTGIDYRQEMAQFVAAIDAHATATLARMGDDSRPFVLIGQNGESLITNPTYRAHIDGLAKEDLRFAYPNEGESQIRPVSFEEYAEASQYLDKAEAAGIEVFLVEYLTPARQAQYADILQAELAQARAKGMPVYIAHDRDLVDVYEQPQGLGHPGRGAPVPPGEFTPPRTGTTRTDRGSDGDAPIGRAAEDDWMRGGAGTDAFVFMTGAGHDQIFGFEPRLGSLFTENAAEMLEGLAVIEQVGVTEDIYPDASATLINVAPRNPPGDVLFE